MINMDILKAEYIYNLADAEIKAHGHTSARTITKMKEAVEEVGGDYSLYFYCEGNKLLFNLLRFKKHYMES